MISNDIFLISGHFQVVAFLAAMEIMAEQFPGAFSGYSLQVCTPVPQLGPQRECIT